MLNNFKKLGILVLIIALLGFGFKVFNKEEESPIRVACVGDSITWAENSCESYPTQLSKLLGEGWEVKNFGVNGTGVLLKSEKPYLKRHLFKKARSYRPDIIIIFLGTNDTKRAAWIYKEDFFKDYEKLITSFDWFGHHPRIILCIPPPIFSSEGVFHNEVLKDEIIPLIKRLAKTKGLETVDLYESMTKDLFQDGVHPNSEGLKKIAQEIYEVITNHGTILKW